ncbi:MAG: MFS transporter [Anaerolineales bacterium]|jgi:FHS family Na+ dependent glucose MFS transporter 1
MLEKLRVFARNDAIRRTFGYYFLFICLGLSSAIPGPTLPALAVQTHTSLGSMGLVFLTSAVGLTLGTVISGRIFDRLHGHPIMGIAEMFVAAMLFFVPITPWFWILLVIVACQGFACGFISTGANTLLVWTHGEKVGPFMNGLHFSFGLGAFLSPFLVAQVIGIEGGYRLAYWILSAFTLLVGLRMLTLKGSPQPTHATHGKTARPARGPVPYPLVISAMLFLFFYVGAEITFGGWAYTYAITLKLASAAGAAYLTSAFWLAFTVGRLISIPVATRFKPKQVILAALLSCLTVLAVGMLFSGSSTALWLMAIGLGFCMAPIWPTGFTLAGQSIDLTGRVTGIILLGDSFGAMVLPTLVGKIIVGSGPRAMLYLVFGSLVLNLLAFIGMLYLRPPKKPSFI